MIRLEILGNPYKSGQKYAPPPKKNAYTMQAAQDADYKLNM